jgi:hypothetical protein
MPLAARESRKRPDHERRALQRRLDKQLDQMAEFGKDRAGAEEVLAEWNENASDRLQVILDIAYPMDAPTDPTSAAVLLGRIQGFLAPLRKAADTLGLTGQMQLSADKLRDQINDLGEEIEDEEN